jgi:hypothetical protein
MCGGWLGSLFAVNPKCAPQLCPPGWTVTALRLSAGFAGSAQLISRDVVQVPQGSQYPALRRLENRGLLTADCKMSDTGRCG